MVTADMSASRESVSERLGDRRLARRHDPGHHDETIIAHGRRGFSQEQVERIKDHALLLRPASKEFAI